ncbi:hypothetical protein CPC08DRAFT_39648 [Agrocybe pediades]|nr:hypothetical protein CPC08DRAFT_39648 [Agrocybe pediades]
MTATSNKGSAALLQDKHSQAVGRLWKTLSPKDKAPYLALANQVKAIHANAYPDYRYRPAKGQRAQGKRARKPATSSSPPSMSASPSPSSSSSSSLSSPPSLSPSSSRSRSSSSSSSSSPSPSSSSSEGTSLPFLVSCTSAGTVAEPAPFTSLSPFLFPLDEFPTNDSNPIVFDGNMDFPLDPQEMGFSQLVISTGNAFLEEQVQPSSYNHPYYHDGSFNPDAYNWPPTQPEEYQHPLSQTFPVDDVDGHVVGENNTFWNVDFFFGQCTPMAEDMILSIDPSLLHS